MFVPQDEHDLQKKKSTMLPQAKNTFALILKELKITYKHKPIMSSKSNVLYFAYTCY